MNYDCILLLVTTLAHASPTKFGPSAARADLVAGFGRVRSEITSAICHIYDGLIWTAI